MSLAFIISLAESDLALPKHVSVQEDTGEVQNTYSYFLDPEAVRPVSEVTCLGGRDVIRIHTLPFSGWLPWTRSDRTGRWPPPLRLPSGQQAALLPFVG